VDPSGTATNPVKVGLLIEALLDISSAVCFQLITSLSVNSSFLIRIVLAVKCSNPIVYAIYSILVI
jgi:hypothetical protein